MNLLSNSIKFTKEQGSIGLLIHHQPSDEYGDDVEIAVCDTGVGMSKAFLQRMFLPFEQEQSSYTQNYQGSGLGLAITHSFVEMMGGTIDVVSEEGVGSTFTIHLNLPYCDEALEESISEMQKDTLEMTYEGERVLLAEDNELNQEIIASLLQQKYHLNVDIAENGQQVAEQFEAAAEGTYSLILMDVRMPVMDGNEAASRIRSLERADAKTIPIIALSANAFDEDITLSIQSGMNEYLSKPINVTTLSRMLKKYIRNGGADK